MSNESQPPKHPVQPVVMTDKGTARFRENKIVRFLLDAGRFDMNDLSLMPFSKDDRQQFAQLIGYSVCGYCELSYLDPDIADEAWEEMERLGEESRQSGD